MSAAAKKPFSLMMKRRWAKVRKAGRNNVGLIYVSRRHHPPLRGNLKNASRPPPRAPSQKRRANRQCKHHRAERKRPAQKKPPAKKATGQIEAVNAEARATAGAAGCSSG